MYERFLTLKSREEKKRGGRFAGTGEWAGRLDFLRSEAPAARRLLLSAAPAHVLSS